MPTQNEKPVTPTATVVDSHGNPITSLSIVTSINTESIWSLYQGLVVNPNSDIEDTGFTVAVYFYPEVTSSNFFRQYESHDNIISIQEWDRQYSKEHRRSDTAFLFKDDAWKKSPRIIFFKPAELVVIPRWDIKTLCNRTFGNKYIQYQTLIPTIPQDPHHYQCEMETCANPATSIALYNVLGSVCQFFVCSDCYPNVHGMRADDHPKVKKQMLLVDGSVVKPQS